MRRFNGSMRLASALALGLMLGGCESLDMSSLTSFLDTKKPLPGERRAVFPEGVPGVAQGVPPEMIKGNEAQAALAAPEPQPEAAKPAPAAAKPKPRPKPRTAAAPKPTPAPSAETAPAGRAQPAAASPWPSAPQQQPQQQPAAASPWPGSPQPQQQRPSTAWPEPRQSGTFTPQ